MAITRECNLDLTQKMSMFKSKCQHFYFDGFGKRDKITTRNRFLVAFQVGPLRKQITRALRVSLCVKRGEKSTHRG
jgi:hypothetical protein